MSLKKINLKKQLKKTCISKTYRIHMKINLHNSEFQVQKMDQEEAESVKSQRETFQKHNHQFKIDKI